MARIRLADGCIVLKTIFSTKHSMYYSVAHRRVYPSRSYKLAKLDPQAIPKDFASYPLTYSYNPSGVLLAITS